MVAEQQHWEHNINNQFVLTPKNQHVKKVM